MLGRTRIWQRTVKGLQGDVFTFKESNSGKPFPLNCRPNANELSSPSVGEASSRSIASGFTHSMVVVSSHFSECRDQAPVMPAMLSVLGFSSLQLDGPQRATTLFSVDAVSLPVPVPLATHLNSVMNPKTNGMPSKPTIPRIEPTARHILRSKAMTQAGQTNLTQQFLETAEKISSSKNHIIALRRADARCQVTNFAYVRDVYSTRHAVCTEWRCRGSNNWACWSRGKSYS